MIPLIKSTFYHEAETKEALIDFIRKAKFLSMGEECAKFEKRFAKFQQRKYAVFVSSGSMANLVLVQVMKNLGIWKEGDKIGFSTLTWPTNVMPLIQLGFEPVAIDCEIETLNVSPEILEKHLDRLDGLFLTNALGFSDNIQKIANMCKEKGIVMLEDNCESLGSRFGDTLLGNFGLASTFSFFVGHQFSTIEGGMICTDNEELRDILVMVRAHGWDRNLEEDKQQALRKKHGIDDFYSLYTFYDLAYNARPTEIQGFLGNYQMQFLQEIIDKRHENFTRFHKATKENDKIIPLQLNDKMSIVSNFGMPLVFKTKAWRDEAYKRFQNAGVQIRPIISGDIIEQPFFKKYYRGECRNAKMIHRQGFYFGNNPEMTEDEILTIKNLICG